MKKILAIFSALALFLPTLPTALANETENVAVTTLILEEDGTALVNDATEYCDGYGYIEPVGASMSEFKVREHEKSSAGKNIYINWTSNQSKSARYYPRLSKGEYKVSVYITTAAYQVNPNVIGSDGTVLENGNGTTDYGLAGQGEFREYGTLKFTGVYGEDYVELVERLKPIHAGYGYNTGWSVQFDAVKFERLPKAAFDVTDGEVKMYSYNTLNDEEDYIELELAGDSFAEDVELADFAISGLPAGITVDRVERIDDTNVRLYFAASEMTSITSDMTFKVKILASASQNCTMDSDYVECSITAPEKFTIEANAEQSGSELSLTASVVNTHNKTYSGVALVGIYDGAKMIDKKITELTNIESDNSVDINESFDVGAADNANVKIFVWDDVLYTDDYNLMYGGTSMAEPFMLYDDGQKAKSSENDTLTIEVNSYEEAVTLSGKVLQEKEKTPVMVKLETEDGEEITHFDEILVSDDLTYNYTYVISNPVDDTPYNVYVPNFFGGDSKSFKFYSATFRDETLEDAQDESGDAFVKFVKDNAVILDVDLTPESTYAGLSEQAQEDFWIELEKAAAECDDHTDFKTVFKETVDGMAVVDSVNAAEDEDALIEILEDENELFGIELNDDFDEYKETVAEDMLDLTYHSVQDVTDDVYDKLLSEVLNAIDDTDRSTMLEKLELYRDIIGIDEDFFGSNESTYVKYMMGKTYTSVENIKETTDDAIEWGKDDDSSSSSDRPTSNKDSNKNSSSKKSSSIVIVPVTDEEKEPVITAEEANAAFSDLDSVSWAKAEIEALAERGIVSGKAEKTFAPNDLVTRAEFAKMLVLAFGTYNESLVTESFSDVTDADWFYSYVANAEERGVINGRGDGTFGVYDNITREDMCVMVYRQLQAAGKTLTAEGEEFADSNAISEYAKEAVLAMKNAGIVNGVDESNFAPLSSCTRAMAAKVIFEALNLQ